MTLTTEPATDCGTLQIIACRWQLVLNVAYYAVWGWYAGTVTCQNYIFYILKCLILCGIDEFYVHVTVHHNKFLYNKTHQTHKFPKFTPAWNSACFGKFLCPSSGVYSLYTRHWYMSYSFRAGPGWNCSSILVLVHLVGFIIKIFNTVNLVGAINWVNWSKKFTKWTTLY